ncbi:hypothetical protein DXG03_009537 [Asterophora parasitica]|uniref:Uncharacterized protein n=1 Tax=Asterophora parasitica TaxID=117018 RepID=A0A9P7G4S2_9AGAR|nr:hypothetical protein DXG03_009537 [Asterophora parasitica]
MATKFSSARATNTPLRHRINVQDGKSPSTHTITLNGDGASGSLTSSDSTKDFIAASDIDESFTAKHKHRRPALMDDESESGSDDGELEGADVRDGAEGKDVSMSPNYRRQSPPLAPIDTANLPAADRSHPSPMSPSTRAWYEFDLAVVVALVSPIGNWLTGGDYIKNVFLIILLIFYLHQIIEVPWELYRKARPRRRAPTVPAASGEDHYKQVATSELRALEFFFLGLAAASPFLGAIFLRYATAAVIGEESVSWFSTALFVLATGMRPWSHVIERFKQRTTDLHDVIHYPSPDLSTDDMHVQMAEMIKRVEHLERALAKAKTRFLDATEDMYDYVDEAVFSVDRTVKRYERKYEKQEAKVKEIEQTLEGLTVKGKGKGKAGLTITTTSASTPPPSLLSRILPEWMFTAPPQRSIYASPSYSPSKHSLRSFPSSSSMQLETIPEEEIAQYPVLAQPANITSLVLSRVGYVATMPLRAVVRMAASHIQALDLTFTTDELESQSAFCVILYKLGRLHSISLRTTKTGIHTMGITVVQPTPAILDAVYRIARLPSCMNMVIHYFQLPLEWVRSSCPQLKRLETLQGYLVAPPPSATLVGTAFSGMITGYLEELVLGNVDTWSAIRALQSPSGSVPPTLLLDRLRTLSVASGIDMNSRALTTG